MAKQAKTKKKSVLDWLVPLICVVVVLGALAGILVNPISKGIDNAKARKTVLLESADGSVALTRPVTQTITWLQLYQSFYQSYSNYSIYKYYQSIFGSSIDLSSLISSSEISWLEQNLYYMEQNLGLTFYTQADVSESSGVTSESVEASAVVFALYMASGIDSNAGSYIGSTLETLKHYVSIAAAAKAAGVELDEEDLANVEESIENFRNFPERISYKGSFKKFLKNFVGSAVRESDIREAYEVMALASKYNEMISDKNYDEVTDSDRTTYVEENKGDFYTAKYLKYTTKNEELVDLFKAATDKDSFIAIVAKEILDQNYASLIAKYEQENSLLAHTEEYYEDVIDGALTGEGFGELTTYEKGVNDPEEALANAIFTGDGKSNTELYLVEGTSAVYLVWFKSASAERSEVRVKTFPYGGLESYAGIEDFRQALYLDVIKSIKEDTTTYTYPEAEQGITYMDLVDEALKVVKEAVPSETSVSYSSDAKENTFEAWISDSARKVGDVRTVVTTEDVEEGSEEDPKFKECEVELVLSTMALNETTTVNGGYLEYDSENAAKEGKNGLAGKTGIALVEALGDLSSSAVTNSAFEEDDFDEDIEALKDWFFSSERKAGDMDVLTVVTETTETNDEGEETTKTETKYYLVCYYATMKAWEAQATSGFASQKTSDWIEELETTVKLNEKALTKLGVDLSEAEEDAE